MVFDSQHRTADTDDFFRAGGAHAAGLDPRLMSQILQAAAQGPAQARALLAQLPPSLREQAIAQLHRERGSAFVERIVHGDGAPDATADPARTALDAVQEGPGTALPHHDQLQAAFGAHDVSTIRVHDTPAAARGAVGIGAQAYASGENVAMFGGGLREATHEAAHVVQQRGAARGGGVVENSADEAHADAVADAVVAGKSVEPMLDQVAKPGTTASPGSIARIKDTRNGGAPVNIAGFSEQQCYLYLHSDAMVPGTVWCGWEWEAGDKAAIEARFDSLKGGQFATFKTNLSNGTLDASAAARKIDPATVATFDALVDSLKADPRVINFDAWFYGSVAFNVSDPDKLLDTINELRAAQARLGSLAPTEKLDLAERGTGTTKSTGEEYTADGTYAGSASPKQYEVKTVRTPGYEVSGITSQINEGLSKFEASPPGSYEVVIYAAYEDAAQTVPLAGTATRDDTPDPAAGKVKRDIKVGGTLKSSKDYVFRDEILKWLNSTWKTKGQASKVSVHMENGLAASFARGPGGWA